jgi:dTDP-4-dehydrorhamnose reductase
MKRILITGANGLLGQKLIALYNDKSEYEVLGTSKGEKRYPQPVAFATMDITDRNDVLKVVTHFNPDWIINTAAMTNVDQCETEKDACVNLNISAVTHLIEACEASRSKLLHLSTDFIFDGNNGPYDEEAVANPLSYYGHSKLAAEQLVLASSIHWAIARTVLVYGIAHDMSRSNIILWVKSSLEQGKSIKVVNDQWRTPTLAEDLAMGCFLIADQDAQGIFNISGKDFLNPYQMAVATADYYKLDSSLIEEVDGTQFTQPAKRPPKTGFVIDKAVKQLGYVPHSFIEGIALLDEQIKAKAK